MANDDAARWAIRRDAGPLSDEDQASLEAWLAEDPRREGALLRAEAVLAYLDRGRALAGSDDGAGEAADEVGASLATRRRRFLSFGALASAAAFGFAAFLLLPPKVKSVETGLGEVLRLPLADGSIATMNTASRISVMMRDDRRSVLLENGEAWFQVAHDARRPFVVDAGSVRVRAVGTAFSVKRQPDGVDILVTEGVVESWIEGRESQPVRMSAGAHAFVRAGAADIATVNEPDTVERALAWRNGEIAMSGEPLSYAVAELNRYNRIKIRIEDARLGQEPVVGYFRTNEPEEFLRSIAPLIGARVEAEGDTLRIFSNRD